MKLAELLMQTDSGHPECDVRIRQAAQAITDLEVQIEQLLSGALVEVETAWENEKADLEALAGELGEALKDAEQTITCGSKGASCYCPNCDTSFSRTREVIRATLAKLEKARGKDQTDG